MAFGNHTDGDADQELDSDGYDFLLWQQQFTRSPAFAVPEPRPLWILFNTALVAGQSGRRKVL